MIDTATASPDLAEHARWVAVAERVAAEFAADVVERDRAGAAPRTEVTRLREAGLLPLLVPTEVGGVGATWTTAFAVVSRVAAVDASIGHLLGYHYLHSWRTRLGRRTDIVRRLDAGTAEHRWLWGGAGNPRDAPLQLERVDGGYLVRGKKFFATGAEVSDRVLATGRTADERFSFAIPTATEGITHGGDWNALGQRASASGSITFDGAFLSDDDVIGPGEQTDPGAPAYPSLSVLGFQALLALIQVSIAEGALIAGAAYTAKNSRPWATSGVATAIEDPLTRARYGELASAVRAARALTDRAAARWVAAAAQGWDLTWEGRGETAVDLSAAKVVTTKVALETAQTVFELCGARATTAGTGLDRYWRDARTLTLHDPVAYKATEVGDNLLTGTYPTPSQYS